MEINLRSMQHRSSTVMTPTTPGAIGQHSLLSPLTGTGANGSPALVHMAGSAVKAAGGAGNSVKSNSKGAAGNSGDIQRSAHGARAGSRTPGRSEKKKRTIRAPGSAPRLLRGSSRKQRGSEKKPAPQQDENTRKNVGGQQQHQQQKEELTPLKRLFQEAMKEGGR